MKPIIKILTPFLITVCIQCCIQDTSHCPHTFTLPVSIIPAQEVYSLGDTINIISEFNDQVSALTIEKKEAGTFDMHGIKWKPAISYYKLDTLIPNRDDHISDFSNFAEVELLLGDLQIHRFSSRFEQVYGEYQEQDHIFKFSLNIIPKRKGLYFIEFSSDNGVVNIFQDFPGACDRELFYVNFDTNEGAENNYHLIFESPDTYWNNIEGSGINRYGFKFKEQGGYCFRVE
ncbi:MAG TPA: hypothetical protein P5235_00800 [Saprospiraceae bacterium]|nr:hypothetical protein [Saprospiraceae bacterium]